MDNSLSLGIRDDILFIEAAGEMRAGDAFALNDFLIPYLEKTDRRLRIYIDMNRCSYMDSTFIGFILSLAGKCGPQGPESVTILNPSEKSKKALKGLFSMDHLAMEEDAPRPDIPLFRLESQRRGFGDRKNVELVFEAHRRLSEISEENRREFRELLEELQRILEG